MEKAIREAKVHTSWTNPDEEYEAAVRALRRAASSAAPPFLAELARARRARRRAPGGSPRSRRWR